LVLLQLVSVVIVAAGASLEASMAVAAVQSAMKLQLKQAAARPQVMSYLQDVFASQPEVLDRFSQAWPQEEQQAPVMQRFDASAAAGSNLAAGSNSTTTGRDSCETCEALAKLYEADWPRFQSRMEGAALLEVLQANSQSFCGRAACVHLAP
jgi:hypothetical protein